jgi:hypothetical protein
MAGLSAGVFALRRGARYECIANCKLQIANCKLKELAAIVVSDGVALHTALLPLPPVRQFAICNLQFAICNKPPATR